MAELPEGMARGSMANLPIYLGQQTYSFAGPNDRIFVYPSVNIQLRFEEDASLCAPLALSPARARAARRPRAAPDRNASRLARRIVPQPGAEPDLQTTSLFTVSGPPEAAQIVSRLEKDAEVVDEKHRGLLGPLSAVTLPAKARKLAGIPANAASFAFAYPHLVHAGRATALVNDYVGSTQREMEPVLLFLLLGGFCYFDERGRLLRVNGLSFQPSKFMLYLDGPYAANPAAGRAMKDFGRMLPETLEPFLDAGLVERGWVNPNECPGGHQLSDEDHSWHSGAFIARTRAARGGSPSGGSPSGKRGGSPAGNGGGDGDDGDGEECYEMYLVQPTQPRHMLTTAPVGLLRGLTSLAHTYSQADESSARLAADLRRFRRTPAEKWLRAYGLLLPAYYGIGVYAYGRMEGWGVRAATRFLSSSPLISQHP